MPKLMTRLGTVFLAATALTGTQLATAQSYRDYRDVRPAYHEPDRRKHRHDNDAVVGAVAGLVIGALIGSAVSSHDKDDRRYSDYGYDPDPQYGASGYGYGRETVLARPSRYGGYDERIYVHSRRDDDCDDDDDRWEHHGRGQRKHRHSDWDD